MMMTEQWTNNDSDSLKIIQLSFLFPIHSRRDKVAKVAFKLPLRLLQTSSCGCSLSRRRLAFCPKFGRQCVGAPLLGEVRSTGVITLSSFFEARRGTRMQVRIRPLSRAGPKVKWVRYGSLLKVGVEASRDRNPPVMGRTRFAK